MTASQLLGAWYEPLRHAMVVPTYVYDEGVQEIADLKGRGDEFGNQIVGIEAGAGITREANEAVETYEPMAMTCSIVIPLPC